MSRIRRVKSPSKVNRTLPVWHRCRDATLESAPTIKQNENSENRENGSGCQHRPCSASSPGMVAGCAMPPRRSGGTILRSVPETPQTIRGNIRRDALPDMQGSRIQQSVPQAPLPVVRRWDQISAERQYPAMSATPSPTELLAEREALIGCDALLSELVRQHGELKLCYDEQDGWFWQAIYSRSMPDSWTTLDLDEKCHASPTEATHGAVKAHNEHVEFQRKSGRCAIHHLIPDNA